MSKQLNTKNKFFKVFSVKELIAFIIALLLITFGLTMLVLGLIDDYKMKEINKALKIAFALNKEDENDK